MLCFAATCNTRCCGFVLLPDPGREMDPYPDPYRLAVVRSRPPEPDRLSTA
jgi:hypothetical protein